MTDPHPPEEPPAAEDLQFDEAEYTAPTALGPTCIACKREIASTYYEPYYEINGQIVCEPCRNAVVVGRTGRAGGLQRFVRASIFGLGGAVAGFAIYFGVAKLTGLEIGLISIVVGFLVGAAVRAGSYHRGGWLYQALAMMLTYSAIAASYSALVLPGLIQEVQKNADPNGGIAAGPAAGKPGVAVRPHVPQQPPLPGVPRIVRFAVGSVLVLVFMYAIPIIAGFQSPIGLFIIAFAIWEAWKLNRRVRLVFSGPFRIGDAPRPEELPAHG